MESYQGQQQDTHPALFDQSQLKDGFGPVYAIPSFPWQDGSSLVPGSGQWHHSHGQGTGNSQWQQWGGHHQAMTPYWCYPCCYGHQSRKGT